MNSHLSGVTKKVLQKTSCYKIAYIRRLTVKYSDRAFIEEVLFSPLQR